METEQSQLLKEQNNVNGHVNKDGDNQEHITVERMFEPYFGNEFDNWHDDYDNSSFMLDS